MKSDAAQEHNFKNRIKWEDKKSYEIW